MKKLTFSILFLSVLSLGIVSCSTEESNEQAIQNEQNSVIEQADLIAHINSDITNGVNYAYPENKYDYSAKNFNSFLEANDFERSSESKETYISELTSYYESLGYTKEEIDLIFNEMPKYSYNSFEELIDDQIQNPVEAQILKDYLNTLMDNSISEKEFERITSVYENAISNADFTEKEKRDMLTVFDMGNYIKKNELSTMKYGMIKADEITCAGNIIIYMTGGAILANGAGAAVGIVYGLWADYNAGCMD